MTFSAALLPPGQPSQAESPDARVNRKLNEVLLDELKESNPPKGKQ